MRTTTKLSALLHCCWALSSGFAQNTNRPVFLQPSKDAPGAPAILRWTSDPMAVYSIEYSTTLKTNDWLPAQGNFPAQGTNTWWSDTGSEFSLSPRLSSADPLSPFRFYRLCVERYMSNASPVTATIDNVNEGTILSGLVDVQATGIATQGLSSAKIYVDGDQTGVEAGSSYTFSLETRSSPNGPHRLSVVAQDAGAVESTEETNAATGLGATYGATNIDVMFSNSLSNVRVRYQAFRPDLGQTQNISGVWSAARAWRLDVTPASDLSTVLQSFSGAGTEISVAWDGKDSNGSQITPQLLGYQFYDLGPDSVPQSQGAGSMLAVSQNQTRALPYPISPGKRCRLASHPTFSLLHRCRQFGRTAFTFHGSKCTGLSDLRKSKSPRNSNRFFLTQLLPGHLG